MKGNYYKICIALIVVALLFIMLGHVYHETIQGPLKKKFMVFPESSIDWWSVSHFLLFGAFGFLIPERPLSAFTLGVGFELVEDFLASNESTQLSDCSDGKGLWCNGIQDDYWYMNPTDPWVNLLGYVTGSAIRTTWFKKLSS